MFIVPLLLAVTLQQDSAPRALALDATGAVLVYDEKAERLMRYR